MSRTTAVVGARAHLHFLCDPTEQRHVAVQLAFPLCPLILLVAAYLPVSPGGRRLLADSFLQEAYTTGLRAIVLPDWSQSPDLEPISACRLPGMLRWPDEDLGIGACGATRRGSPLDYMMVSSALTVCRRHQLSTTSDHDAVMCEVCWLADKTSHYIRPSRARLAIELTEQARMRLLE